MKISKLLIPATLTLIVLSGCSSTTKPTALPTVASASPSPTNPYGAAPVDPPGPNEPILTLGKGKKSIKLTLKAIAALGTKKYTIFEPFQKSQQTFTAVTLKQLFDLVGISGTDSVTTYALNDYKFVDTAVSLINSNALLAIARADKAIPYDQGGPIRIIFPAKQKLTSFLDAWNWSLSSITVK
ncbi:MAG: molybdopterin-dependent oxidoreductase [Actinomycetes bacterium]